MIDRLKRFFQVTKSYFWLEMDFNLEEQGIELDTIREANIILDIVYKETMKCRLLAKSEGVKDEKE